MGVDPNEAAAAASAPKDAPNDDEVLRMMKELEKETNEPTVVNPEGGEFQSLGDDDIMKMMAEVDAMADQHNVKAPK